MTIYSFSSEEFIENKQIQSTLGYRAERLMQLAKQGVPILPGCIILNNIIQGEMNLGSLIDMGLEKSLKTTGEKVGKAFGDEKNPLLIKLVLSPQLNLIDQFSSVHNIGLCDSTLEGFASFVGEEFAYHEYKNLFKKIISLEMGTLEEGDERFPLLQEALDKLNKVKALKSCKTAITGAKALYKEGVFKNPLTQLYKILSLYKAYLAKSESVDDSAIMLQAMTFGNYGDKSYFGSFSTRDIVTGEDKLSGGYYINSFDATSSAKELDINTIDNEILGKLKTIAKSLEIFYKEIRKIKFTVENGNLWVIDQSEDDSKSIQAHLRTLLDLVKSGDIDKEYIVKALQPSRLAEILHPVLDRKSAKDIDSFKGGIAGSVGAAVGRVFFSTERLMKEQRICSQRGLETDFILILPSSYAEDVKGIEVAQGVLTRDGGYASHAPVVARSLGKVAMVNPDLKILKNSVKIGDKTVKEGDYLSLDVTSYDKPMIYFGKVGRVIPTIEESGILEYLEIIQEFIGDFDVHANADQPKDALLADKFNAHGIGLCRTEHMFFKPDRILLFRSLVIANEKEDRANILSELEKMQTADFYELFKIMAEKPVTIRLLDAPLHEFLPHTRESMIEFIEYYKGTHPGISEADIRLRCDMVGEVNPMLGHRGIRVAISSPEIYAMQIAAIFKAIYKLHKEEGILSKPEIMLPVVMSEREVKTVRFGKRIEGAEISGIRDIEEQVRQEYDAEPIAYKVGTMIELPGAALRADRIARYADFFSFGTNDLTQTTNGISRDDFNSFFTDYNEFDLLEKNPFKYLNTPVKELVETATQRGRLVRPDLKLGLCGEHGAEPENIKFCIDNGLNYVSCSPYGIPIAKLAIAQYNLEQG